MCTMLQSLSGHVPPAREKYHPGHLPVGLGFMVMFSGGLPIRQNKQLPKARHGAGARPVQRKAKKMFY